MFILNYFDTVNVVGQGVDDLSHLMPPTNPGAQLSRSASQSDSWDHASFFPSLKHRDTKRVEAIGETE